MSESKPGLLAIIGGSGLYDLPGLVDTRWVDVETPWGAPSDQVFLGRLGDARLAFLPRHGRGHRIPPSEVNYRANIAALKMLGATDVLSLSAVGGLRADLPPGSFVVVDQFIDRTFAREKSFFGRGLVAHVSMADPVCKRLGEHLGAALVERGVPHARTGTYLVMEGPQFSTRAESALYRSWNCSVIGMTNMPEAKLAREAELCYASVGMVTDFDCWHPAHDAVTVDAVIRVLLGNAEAARGLVKALAATIASDPHASACACRRALDHALITAPEARDPAMVRSSCGRSQGGCCRNSREGPAMKIDGRPTRPIRALPSRDGIEIIDQRRLPFELRFATLRSAGEVFVAIREMWLRGAPLIGAAAAYGIALEMRRDAGDEALQRVAAKLRDARPTAVNLAWAIDRMQRALAATAPAHRAERAWDEAAAIAEEDVACNLAIGEHGLAMLRKRHSERRAPNEPLRALTHCNAGWLATVDWGTATAPIYLAHEAGLPIFVWVDETRPRNQGASLTAWELQHAGVPHAVIADNAGGHLMQRGEVDLVIVGCDRVAANGDVCNKIGTYLKALAAHDNGVPFVVAMPVSTFDAGLASGDVIPIEERSAREVTHLWGRGAGGELLEMQITPDGSDARNPAFDVTPARLVSAVLTERGVFAPDRLAAELDSGAKRRA